VLAGGHGADRQTLNDLLRTDIGSASSHFTFCRLLAQSDVLGLKGLRRNWIDD